ncbi:HEPN domain-containing protein [Mogibacterium diversum]|uniref:ApeA N-terminal domain 1-containing protein n=1 Tax=Mogibacterium diversum TaxID=114527 RepID=UPI0028E988D4|nr:HEPN domain-containing protein [Mogibacterium diversum]
MKEILHDILPCSGIFHINDIDIKGTLHYENKEGRIILKLLRPELFLNQNYMKKNNIITGTLDIGLDVTLFNNRCISSKYIGGEIVSGHYISFEADYVIFNHGYLNSYEFDELEFTVENAIFWSGFHTIERTNIGEYKIKTLDQKSIISMYGAKIEFSVYLNNGLDMFPVDEETKVTFRLLVKIVSKRKQRAEYFIDVRNKILSLISFATKDNVNVEKQILFNYNDTFEFFGDTQYEHKIIYTNGCRRAIIGTNCTDYNFFLADIKDQDDLSTKLNLLDPVFNLYASKFRYNDMPKEMVFLNMIQAIETFHSRFFYNDKKTDFIKSIKCYIGNEIKYEEIKKLLLSLAQMDNNCKHINLVSRVIDLLIRGNNELFKYYYEERIKFAQDIVNTRHYFTHYGQEKENKALKGDKLDEAIEVLILILDYHICKVLGVNNERKIEEHLNEIKIQYHN